MKHMIITKELVIDGYNTRNSKPVFCITTGEIFPSQYVKITQYEVWRGQTCDEEMLQEYTRKDDGNE